ncbi:hypothetical protein FQR65_LT03956 [Abscondita terminalis]|nr:hypothetical protein FQR65_LT03956 [Abscondita terminalis]
MCTSSYSLLLILLTCLMGMVTEGLPLTRQERGTHQDILAGADFLSVLIESSARHEMRENPKTTPTPSTTVRATLAKHAYRKSQTPIRELRIPRSTSSSEFHSSTEFSDSVKIKDSKEPRIENNSDQLNNKLSASNKTNTSLVVSVQVSSSEGNSRINKITSDVKNLENKDTQSNAIVSEEYKTIPAEMNKSDFSVDESEPITISTNAEFAQGYTVNIPNSNKFQEKDKFEPQSLSYDDQPTEYGRGRSVSYSTVIQALPKSQPQITVKEGNKQWVGPTPNFRERQERHFEIKKSPNENQFEDKNKNYKSEQSPTPSAKTVSRVASSSVAETNDYFVTAKYEPDNYQKQFLNNKDVWNKPEFISEQPQPKITPSTEKYWELPTKNRDQPPSYLRPLESKRQRVPVVYGKPEQNYEVDESVSVMSNGRVHGVQANKFSLPSQPADSKVDPNDNQKVGYVVEGRNYRKYRVEERTADGFIVGEYGVVSHDDGSLRGVRYTADGTTNPRLIYDALMKFLSL